MINSQINYLTGVTAGNRPALIENVTTSPLLQFLTTSLGSQTTGDRRLLVTTEKKMTQKLNQVYLTSLKKFIAKHEKDPALQGRVFLDIVKLLEHQANDLDLLAALNNEPRWTGMIGRTLCRITANLFFDYKRDGAQK